ncbi:hypothetical protein BN159_0702 [Streptomyces davaonensis JCM 4913]|uniref:Uncharacterized protein n=1 Tax=Streptomyces davaonensis (strain DSM 101723 / JCM 4913 / KCC S-0913 / 768) TaxID=1214101 RepID=K4QSQ9_STRDJ|nr:hypothetical protein [Streptomyces davaonensis]CCK25081.1 hypothetical protein BN159_0702 [Streptomyces davaonensis JCM 4913]
MPARTTTFKETMLGRVHLADEDRDRPMRLDLVARTETVLLPHRTTQAHVTGRVRIAGRADDPEAEGELEISPLARRRIRYRVTFTLEGRRLVLDGWKSVSPARPLTSMTVLPFSLYEDGERVGEGRLRFPVTTGLVPFLTSFRFPRTAEAAGDLAPRWDGKPGRTEVWYTTLTDPATGTGVWLHHEVVAPTDGSGAYAHGWVAVFPKDGPAEHARFGPLSWTGHDEAYDTKGILVRPGRLAGTAGPFTWELTETPQGPPLHTFPRWSWRRPWLPASQMLPAARCRYDGTVHHGTGELRLEGAVGASARIYGHGNARRWAWLHADLGDGDVLEIIAAVSMRRGLDRLPPLVFLRLLHNGRTWPRRSERAAVGWAGLGRFRAELGLPEWRVAGRVGRRRIRVTVTQPPERTLALDYTDPDGSAAVCRNSETADAVVTVERWWGRWRQDAVWRLSGTAHAEVGDR